MKKEFLYVMMAAAAMSSCSNDKVVDEVEGSAISFRTSLDRLQTRGTVKTLANLESFNVTAINTSDNKPYFTDVTVTSSDNGNSWATTGNYYWPGKNLQFFGWAPAEDGAETAITAEYDDGMQIADFSPAANVANQVDLLASTSAAQSSGTVAMNFKHILSQISVKAKCSNSDVTINVLGVKLGNIGSKGTFTFPTTETVTEGFTWNTPWKLTEDATAYMVGAKSDGTVVTLTSEAQSIMSENFFLIPQTLTAWAGSTTNSGAYIGVLCNIKVANGSNAGEDYKTVQIYPEAADKYAFAAIPINTTWEPGKKYVYTLDFCGSSTTTTGGCGKVSPDQTAPTDCGVSSTITNEIDATGITKNVGDDIFGGAIKFSVTVEDWGTETAVDVTM